MRFSRCVTLCSLSLLLAATAFAQIALEYPAYVQPRFADIPLDGGRVHAITVHPTDPNRMFISCSWGGMWKTADNTARWTYVHGLRTLFARDIVYSPDGNTLVATIMRDNQVVNGGGIYVSRDDGATWSRPTTAIPPASTRTLARTGAWGVSFAPDIAGRIYAGTDYGVAMSSDNGVTWNHTALDPTGPRHDDRLQDAAFSLLALPGDRAIATTRRGVFMKAPNSSTWTRIRNGNFGFADGFKMLDVSPLDADKVFILQNYNTLLLFEVASNTFTTLTLPGGNSRGPFVRVSLSAAGPNAIDIWVGAGVKLLKVTRNSIADVRTTVSTDWRQLHRAEGLHDDSGHLGLDGNKRPVLYGSDGGVFRPANADATMWTHAALSGSRLNSYQMTDLTASTAFASANTTARTTALHFATQDNGLWASTDDGATWPNSDCAEGYHVRARAEAPLTSDVTVGYGKVGCGPSGAMFSDFAFTNQRAVPDVDPTGAPLTLLESPFFVAPGKWVRIRRAPGSNPEIFVSDNNGLNWRKRAEVSLTFMGVFVPSTVVASGAPVLYIPFRGEQTTADGRPRDGLIRLDDPFGAGIRNFSDSDLIYLPNDGSLGTRSTEFDWQSVFAVDPRDSRFLIAPDIINCVVKVSADGGATWSTDTALTDLVLDQGRLIMYDDESHMQVTHIRYDPFNSNRILVGTRDAGIIRSYDHGSRWRKIGISERALYVTGFGFKSSGLPVYASTYGRGLWKITDLIIIEPFPQPDLCRWIRNCTLWPLRFAIATDPVTVNWSTRDVVVFGSGHANGLVLNDDGSVRIVSVSPGTQVRRYNPTETDSVEFPVIESEQGLGFAGLKGPLAALDKGEVIGALVFEKGMPASVVGASADFELPQEQEEKGTASLPMPKEANKPAPPPKTPRPYLLVSTDLPGGGLAVLADNGVIHVSGRGFSSAAGSQLPRILIDGVDTGVRPSVTEGRIHAKITVSAQLLYGKHRVEVVQQTQGGEVRAEAPVIKAPIDNFGTN